MSTFSERFAANASEAISNICGYEETFAVKTVYGRSIFIAMDLLFKELNYVHILKTIC